MRSSRVPWTCEECVEHKGRVSDVLHTTSDVHVLEITWKWRDKAARNPPQALERMSRFDCSLRNLGVSSAQRPFKG